MTTQTDEIETSEKFVVTVDICSSTHLIGDLLPTGRIGHWRNLLIGMKEYLNKVVTNTG
jgi:hypothetical protein